MAHDVALFITCLTDQFYPRVGIAVTKILEHFGCAVSFPPGQTCCGQPFYNNGFHPQARELAKHFLEVFEDCQYIVTPSGSCCAMVREQFHELFHEDPAWSGRMKKVSGRTYEFVEFLDKVLKVDLSAFSLPRPEPITYHYTCHLRGIGVKDEGVRLLQQIGNVEFRPMEKTDQCCGFGGTFATKYPAISGAIVEDKMQCIAATKAGTVICNDAGCTMNIAGMCNRHHVPVKTRHIAELLADAMGLDTRGL
ncbi:MAG TPA: (Fe-S)-binding protein [Tepidisphaeraceae bacterium]|nr:(Fe-S)-binding protein [Tepidisphaeraceae bacterium]